ncbi:hypothetical protein [Candidatus Methylocalor cossyra]|uniref:Uncharacterized protein n=1 Tax=Candidatus Methylocalor cossyra TaxID=3108543 RepID=A0ABM9NIW1_9GAMM
MTGTIEGELQSLSGEGFEGWAWNSALPYDPVEVEVLCHDTVIATATADRFSLELVKRRKGNGMHGFLARPEALPPLRYPLKIWARVRGTEVPLDGTLTLHSPAELREVLPPSLLRDYDGYVDGISDGRVVGWAVNRALPDEPVEVELWDGGRVIARASANHFREDVERQFPGAGHSGFELVLPYELLDGQLHSLSVRVADSRHELHNSPIQLGPGAANALVREIIRLRDKVQAWEARLDEFSRSLIARFEALYTLQRDSFEREIQALKTAALGFPRLAEGEPALKVVRATEPSMPPGDSAPGPAASRGEPSDEADRAPEVQATVPAEAAAGASRAEAPARPPRSRRG